MRTRTTTIPRPFTDLQLAALEKSSLKHLGRFEQTGRKLIGELRAAKALIEKLTEGYLRMRTQLIELDENVMPSGRVLLVECPPAPHSGCLGETLLISDGKLDLHSVACPVDADHTEFEDVLLATLELPINTVPMRFRSLPRELTRRPLRVRHYRPDWKNTVAALTQAQITQDALTALDELRERLNETKPAQAQDAAEKQVEPQTKEQRPSEVRTDPPEGKISVPW